MAQKGSHEIAFAGDYEAHNLGFRFTPHGNAPIPVRGSSYVSGIVTGPAASGLGPELADMGPDARCRRDSSLPLQLSGEMTHWVMSQSSRLSVGFVGTVPRGLVS